MKDYTRLAVRAAKSAAEILHKNYGKIQNLEYKLKTNFKTELDDKCDNLIRGMIVAEFQKHNLYSEENPALVKDSRYSWVVDPLDGTIPYTYGISHHFAISIALLKDQVPIMGVIYAPFDDSLYVAEIGNGAFCNGSRINVSSLENVNHAIVALDYGKVKRNAISRFQEKLLGEDGVAYTVSYACASVSLALVASGKLHGYMALKLEPWDMAAAVVINREAGAKVTTIDGKEWEFGDESILAANPALHNNLCKLFKEEIRK